MEWDMGQCEITPAGHVGRHMLHGVDLKGRRYVLSWDHKGYEYHLEEDT